MSGSQQITCKFSNMPCIVIKKFQKRRDTKYTSTTKIFSIRKVNIEILYYYIILQTDLNKQNLLKQNNK